MLITKIELNLGWERLRLLATVAKVAKNASAPGVYLTVFRKSKRVGVGAGDVSDGHVVESVGVGDDSFVAILMVEEDSFWTLLVVGKGWETELEVVIATPGIGLVLLLDFVILLVLVGHLQERFVVVINSEGE